MKPIIGISLPIGLFVQENNCPECKKYIEAFGNIQNIFDFLRQNDIESIELKYVYEILDLNIIREAINLVSQNNFNFSFHPYRYIQSDNKDFYREIIDIYNLLLSFNKSIVFVLHLFRSKKLAMKEVIDENIRLFNNFLNYHKENSQIKIAFELNRNKGNVDPSNSYENLVTINDRLLSYNTGFCWDIGHAYVNYKNNFIQLVPPSKFMKSVIHAHIHGLSEEGITHFPLNEKDLWMTGMIKQMKDFSYSGIYNIEFSPHKWSEKINLRDEIINSVCLIKKTVANLD